MRPAVVVILIFLLIAISQAIRIAIKIMIKNYAYAFQIMSATVLPAGMNGMTCVL